jgi:hypothetical protein
MRLSVLADKWSSRARQIRSFPILERPHVVPHRLLGSRNRHLLWRCRSHHMDHLVRHLLWLDPRVHVHLVGRLERRELVDRSVGVEEGEGVVEVEGGGGEEGGNVGGG